MVDEEEKTIMTALFTVSFKETGYATISFMDKAMFDVVFSHGATEEANATQKALLTMIVNTINTHETECSNVA